MKGVECVPRLEECVLQHVIGIFMGEHDATNLPIKLLAILTYKCLEPSPLGGGLCKHVFELLVVVFFHFLVYILDALT